MKRQQRNPDLLRMIADALLSARRNPDGRSIIDVDPGKLQWLGIQLQNMIKPAGRGTPAKSGQHKNWAIQYWMHRLQQPEDISGAVRAAQKYSALYWSWEPEPNSETVKRVARDYRDRIFKALEAEGFELNSLRAYLQKHQHVGRM